MLNFGKLLLGPKLSEPASDLMGQACVNASGRRVNLPTVHKSKPHPSDPKWVRRVQ